METKVEAENPLLDTLILLLAGAILVGSILGYYYYADFPTPLRALGVLIALGLAVAVVLQSTQGKTLWSFIQGSRVELRKVVWPTREETLQTTLMVLVFALIMGVFFWLLDLSLLALTRRLTGQGVDPCRICGGTWSTRTRITNTR